MSVLLVSSLFSMPKRHKPVDAIDFEPVGLPPPEILPDLREDRVDVYAERVRQGFAIWTAAEELDLWRQTDKLLDLGKESNRLMNGADDYRERLVIDTGKRQLMIPTDEYDALGEDDEWPDLCERSRRRGKDRKAP